MKKIITILMLVVFNFNSKAQQQELLNVNWIIHYMEVDGVIFNVPQPHPSDPSYNPGIGFYDNGSGLIDVSAILTFNYYFNNEESLSFASNTFMVNHGAVSLGDCYSLCNLESLYLYTILLGDGLTRTFEYEIITNNNEKTLVITSPEGNKAVFGNFVLSISNYEVDKTFKAYPNPAKNEFIIASKSIKTISDILLTIRDINGKTIKKLTKLNTSEDSNVAVDISRLQAGVYFYTIASRTRILKTGKLIKK